MGGLNFGSVMAGMLTLFKATNGGEDWGIYYTLLAKIGWMPSLGFLFFLLFWFVSVWNIVISIFIEKVLCLAQGDMEEQLIQKRRQNIVDAAELRSIMKQADTDGSGKLSRVELMAFLSDPKIRCFFEVRGMVI